MAQTRIILLRHGETVWNHEGRFQGHLDSPLTAAGTEQAQALAGRLTNHSLAALYSSDLGRAQQTAQFIAARTGHLIRLEPRLRERHMGVFQGLSKAEIGKLFPDEYHCFRKAGADYAVPGGESAREHAERAIACLKELSRTHAGTQIAVVTHGGVASAFLRYVLDIPLDAPRRFIRGNATWNVFLRDGTKWFVETWGDTSHLPDKVALDDI